MTLVTHHITISYQLFLLFIPRRPSKSTHESELDDEDLDDEDLEYLRAKKKRIGLGQSEEKDEEKEE